jgi:hypothetical protein
LALQLTGIDYGIPVELGPTINGSSLHDKNHLNATANLVSKDLYILNFATLVEVLNVIIHRRKRELVANLSRCTGKDSRLGNRLVTDILDINGFHCFALLRLGIFRNERREDDAEAVM